LSIAVGGGGVGGGSSVSVTPLMRPRYGAGDRHPERRRWPTGKTTAGTSAPLKLQDNCPNLCKSGNDCFVFSAVVFVPRSKIWQDSMNNNDDEISPKNAATWHFQAAVDHVY
jgi:hypothetical protein